jgi:hypothetical protein
MKKIALLLLLALPLCAEMRTWTDAKTSRTITAEGFEDYVCEIHDTDGNLLDTETATSKTDT